MATIRQIITDWTTINGSGKVSVMFFDAAASASTQRAAIATLFTAYMGACDNSTSYTVRTSGIELNDETGALVNAWSETTARTDSGDQSDEPVADAVQALIRWRTSTIFAGRFVQGRTFLPGLDQEQVVAGNLGSSAQTAINSAATTFAGSAANFRIWSRPLVDDDGNITRGGISSDVTSGSAWAELAVLRRRRG